MSKAFWTLQRTKNRSSAHLEREVRLVGGGDDARQVRVLEAVPVVGLEVVRHAHLALALQLEPARERARMSARTRTARVPWADR